MTTHDNRALWDLVDELVKQWKAECMAFADMPSGIPVPKRLYLWNRIDELAAILERPVVVRNDWFHRAHVTEQKWDAMLRVVRSAKAIGDYLAEFGTLEGIPEIFDALYSSLDACKDACQENG